MGFQTAISLLPMATRDRARTLLATRLENLDRAAEEGRLRGAQAGDSPPHVGELVDYWERITQVERDWLLQVIAHIDEGALSFQDEQWQWTPAADDPGLADERGPRALPGPAASLSPRAEIPMILSAVGGLLLGGREVT